MEHFYNKIEGWFDFQDIYQEVVKKAVDGSHFVELGSWKGKSSAFMAVEILNSNKKIKFDCVDIWDYSEEYDGYTEKENNTLFEEFKQNTFFVKQIINPVRGYTNKVCTLYEDKSLDFVFVDASHKYENVLQDLQLWLPKIKQGGIFAGHDYTYCDDVYRAVNEVLPNDKIKTRVSSWFYIVE